MPTIAVIALKGGVGKSTITECLRQVYKDSQIIDMDHQKTLTILAKINKKPLPVKIDKVSAKYIIYDTPPYSERDIRRLIKNVDRVVIPIRVGPPDIVSFPLMYKNLKGMKAYEKTLVVFNEVRKPVTKIHKQLIEIFKENFPKVKIANTYLSNSDDFKEALLSTLKGKGLEQIKALVKEIDV